MPAIKDITVTKPTEEQIAVCQQWPIWTSDPSKFDWEYTQTETCLIIEGKVTVSGAGESPESVTFGAGDLVVFPTGLKCVWNVEQAVKKHYNFT